MFIYQCLIAVICFIVSLVNSKNIQYPPSDDLGVNLGKLSTTGPLWLFTDLFKHSTPFYPLKTRNNSTWEWENPVNLILSSAKGYPTQLPIYTSGQWPAACADFYVPYAGSYVLLYDGTGELELGGNTTQFSITSQAQGRIVVTVTTDYTFIQLRIRKLDITNIRFIQADKEATYATTDIFHPKFVESVNPFQTLRVCDLQNENWGGDSYLNKVRLWNSRTVTTDSTQVDSYYGIAFEYIIALANVLKKNIWICASGYAESYYNPNMTTLIKDQLTNQSLKVYVQFSNIGLDAKQALGLRNTINSYIDILGQSRRDNQIYFVIYEMTYEYWPHLESYFAKNFTEIDAVAISGQFGNFFLGWNGNFINLQEVDGLTVDQLIDLAYRDSQDVLVYYNKDIQKVKYYNLSLLAYAGGPFIQSPTYGYRDRYNQAVRANPNTIVDPQLALNATKEQNFANLLLQVNLNSRMKSIIQDFLRRWKNLGGKTFVAMYLVGAEKASQWGNNYLTAELNSTQSKYSGFVAYIKNEAQVLPFTSADITETALLDCSPSCVWGTCYNGTCECFAGYSGSTCSILTPSSKPNYCTSGVGANPDGIADWSTEWAFVDLFKMSREFITQSFNIGGWDLGLLSNVSFDNNQYPVVLPDGLNVGSMMVRDLLGHYEAGTYLVLYDGDGLIIMTMDDVRKTRRIRPGRIEIDIVPQTGLNNGIFLSILWTNPSNPIKNIRVIRPGYENRYKNFPFHPMFLNNMERYETLRFMDWMATNSQKSENWTSRTTNQNRTFTNNGVSLEMIILLTNTLGTNLWINIPHLANDEYVTNMATMIWNNIRPDVKVYVEYSNEVWGTLFPGGQYAQLQGQKLGFSTNPDDARFCFLNYRSAQIFAIFETVFGANNRNRLINVISSQAVNPDVTKRILECNHATVKALNLLSHTDAIGIAPYFDVNLKQEDPAFSQFYDSIDNIMNYRLQKGVNVSLNYTVKLNTFLKANSSYDKLKIVTYESGQSLLGSDSQGQLLAIELNRDSRIQGHYTSYLNGLKQLNVSLICLFTSVGRYSQYGSWGQKEAQDTPENISYKHIAVQNFIQTNGTCSTFPSYQSCKDNTCGGGNGKCLKNGKCSCYIGWQGENCTEPRYVDYSTCGYKCTFDQGVCGLQQTLYGYQRMYGCTCNSSFTGLSCSIATSPTNCSNFRGVTPNNSTCQCFDGFAGSQCEIDCGCNGHGICSSDNQSCLCEEGYKFDTGKKQCEFDCKCQNTNQYCIAPGECSCLFPCQNGQCFSGQCKCYPGWSDSQCSSLDVKPNFNSSVAINLGGLSYWSTSQPFLNYMKTGSGWISQRVNGYFTSDLQYVWNTGEEIPLDENGWVKSLKWGQAVGLLLLRDISQSLPNGLFLILYDGSGKLNIGFDASIVKQRKGRILINVTFTTVRDNGIFIQIIATDPNDYIRNIRVIRAQYENQFERLIFDSEYKSIRFMDWQHTNSAQNFYQDKNNWTRVDWANRTKPSYPFYSQQGATTGAAIEDIVKLCNILGTDAWINIHTQASDDYVQNLALYLNSTLRKDLRVYVEYGNEVWNPLFDAYWYVRQQGAKQNPPIDNYQFYSKRSVEMFDIFSSVYGASQRNVTTYVLSTQTVSTWVTKRILDYNNAYKKINALGVTGYFDCDGLTAPENASKITLSTLTQLFQRCNDSVNSDTQYIVKILDMLKNDYNNTQLAFYESGPSILEQAAIENGGETPGATAVFISMHRDPRMEYLYQANFQRMLSLGAFRDNPPFHFVDVGKCSKYGCWGAKETMYQNASDAPKYRAIQKFITQYSGLLYKKKGCTNSNATNYDSSAEVNDNSCKFPPKTLPLNLGGTISVDPSVSLNLEPNYSADPVPITVSSVIHQNDRSIGSSFEFGPPGTKFAKPVQVCLKFDTLKVKSSNGDIVLCYSSDGLTWNCNQNNNITPDGKCCSTLEHFTTVSLFQSNLIPQNLTLPNNTTTTQPNNNPNVPNNPITPNNLNNQNTITSEDIKKLDPITIIVLASVFSFVGAAIIVLIIYKIWKNKQLSKIQDENGEKQFANGQIEDAEDDANNNNQQSNFKMAIQVIGVPSDHDTSQQPPDKFKADK